ncbi:MAG: epoxide hydrolase, partial [Myxococcota bacterium]|nr:epoxide hydrolase [Myxococcota bacterium]
MLYWVTGTAPSAGRIYRESRAFGDPALLGKRLETPVGFAAFPKEVILSPRSWLEAVYNLVQYTEMPRGGHFAALEQPELLVEDIRAFFRRFRA